MTHTAANSRRTAVPAPPSTPLRVLFVESDSAAVDLALRALTEAGWDCACERVESEAAYCAALDAGGYDLVISADALPTFDAPRALALLRARDLALPFVLVCGALGAEALRESLRRGAADYVPEGGLQSLAPVVRRALRDRDERRQRASTDAALRDSEARYRALIESAPDLVMTVDAAGTVTALNPAFSRLLGWPGEAYLGRPIAPLLHPDDLPAATAALQQLRAGATVRGLALRARTAGGAYRVIEISAALQAGTGGGAAEVLAIGRDVTASRHAAARTRALLGVASDLSDGRDLPAALRRACAHLAAAAPCDVCVVIECRDGDGGGRLLASAGLPAATPEALPVGAPCGDALRQGETRIVGDAAADPCAAALRALGVASAVIAPLRGHEHAFGALLLGSRSAGALDAAHTELADAAARQIAVALAVAARQRVEREEAGFATAVARAGQELIAALDLPVLLARLCRVTTEVLQCDVSYTLLHREEDDTLVAAAGYGYSADHWQRLSALPVPRAAVATLLEPIARDGLVHAYEDREGQTVGVELRAAYDVRELLAVPLRRGDRLVGVHVAAQRRPGVGFAPPHERIARGLAHLASLALENVRLIDKLEQTNRLKADFLATMSHELRTPLNVIIGYNELLLDEVFGTLVPEQAASLDRVGTSARELLELINATLDISRLETGRAALSLREIDAAELLREVEEETRPLREKPGVISRWLVPDDLPALYSDAVKLKVLLKNLLTNAFKFTDAGSVTVQASAADGWLVLRVTDTGIGMSAETQAVVFEAFRQGDNATPRRHGGVGLGLYIVTRLLDLLGGRVELRSAIGEGAEFRLWVPVDARRPSPSAAP